MVELATCFSGPEIASVGRDLALALKIVAEGHVPGLQEGEDLVPGIQMISFCTEVHTRDHHVSPTVTAALVVHVSQIQTEHNYISYTIPHATGPAAGIGLALVPLQDDPTETESGRGNGRGIENEREIERSAAAGSLGRGPAPHGEETA